MVKMADEMLEDDDSEVKNFFEHVIGKTEEILSQNSFARSERHISEVLTHIDLLERLPFVRTDRSVRTVRKWNASVLRTERTGSGRTGPALELGPASSLAPARLHA